MEKKFYQTIWFAWIMIIFFFPVGLFLLWKYKHHSLKARLAITGILLALIIFNGVFGDKKSRPAPPPQAQKQELKLVDTRSQQVDIASLEHGTPVIVEGTIILGNGRQASRQFETSFGRLEAQPLTIALNSSKKEYLVMLAKPSPSSLFEKALTIKGIIDKKASDPLVSRDGIAIVKAEIIN